MLKILVVDDEPLIRTALQVYLTEVGFEVSEASDGTGMRAVLERKPIDLVLLDLMMPDEDGLTLARQIRAQSDLPIIMVTSKDDVIDRVVGLETGADDYVTKPFDLRELVARIRSVIRRTQPSPPLPGEELAEPSMLEFAGWQLDLVRRELWRPDGTAVILTSDEFSLLRSLASHPFRVLDRERLVALTEGPDRPVNARAVDTRIVRLRRKIEDDPANPTLIKTVRGAGYLFAAAVTKS